MATPTPASPLWYCANEALPPAWQWQAIRVSGPDAAKVLHHRSCNAVTPLALHTTYQGQPCYYGEGIANAVLDRKGYVLAPYSVHRESETSFLILTYASVAEILINEFKKYQLMDVASFETLELQQSVLIHHAGQLPNLPALPANGLQVLEKTSAGTPIAWLIESPFWQTGREQSYTALLLTTAESTLHTEALLEGLPPLEPNQWRYGLLEQGIPLWTVDVTPEEILPQTGLEHWTISYTKGCYLGQETIAKLKTYGGVGESLMGLALPKASCESVALALAKGHSLPLWQAGKRVGRLTSLNPETGHALAYLKRALRVPQTTLTLSWGETSEEVSVETLPTLQATVCLLPFGGTESNTAETQEALAGQLQASAVQLFMEDQPEEALAVLRQVLEEYPTFWQAHETLGVLLGRLERYPEGMAVFENLIQLNPDWVMAYTNLSVYALKLGNKELAEDWKAQATRVAMRVNIQKAMQAKAATPLSEAELEAQLKARRQDAEERIALFDVALQYNPNDALAHYGKGNLWKELGETAQALACFTLATVGNPNHTLAWLNRADCEFELLQYEACQASIEAGLAVASQRGDLQPLTKLQALQERLIPIS
ncbi:MAG: tetratricopeptide repeat protein [Vampirovibrionales bacterium]